MQVFFFKCKICCEKNLIIKLILTITKFYHKIILKIGGLYMGIDKLKKSLFGMLLI